MEQRVAFSLTEHLMDLNELANSLNTKIDLKYPEKSFGISKKRAAERFIKNGPNELAPPPERSCKIKNIININIFFKLEFVKFLLQFTTVIMVLLLAAGVLCFISYGIDTK